jgi:prophage regulatory protein
MQANPSQSGNERLLRLSDVIERVGLKKSAIYAGCSAKPPTFPVPIKLSPRAVAWPESAIQSWIADRIKASKGA